MLLSLSSLSWALDQWAIRVEISKMNLEGRLDQVINTKQKSYREALERMLGAILALSKSWAGYEFQRHSTPAWNRLASATEEVGLAFGELAVARKDAIISA